jgi:4-amino-4-deoxy-L-arabinose transferase-like glycosyltransferase
MILLPLLYFLSWGTGFRRSGMTLLESGTAALVTFGLAVSIVTELQSLTGSLTPVGSAVGWFFVAGAGLFWARRPVAKPPGPPDSTPAGHRPELAVVLLFLILTGAVAVLSAPNSYDALSYHLPRVERWIQQGSLAPFATHDPRQLFMPSWPEYAVLQFRLLSGDDHFANLVQWIGLAGACGGAAVLAGVLGGSRTAMTTAAALVATLPMAVAQASGTQTDVIAACWTVLAVGYGYRLTAGAPRTRDAVLAAIALGLAMATKQTAILFAGLALLPAAVLVVRRVRPRRWLSWGAAVVFAVIVLAGPQLARNREVFGNLRGDPALVGSVVMGTRAPGQVGGNVLRNLSVHFGTPWPQVNGEIAANVARLSRAIGADPDDRRTTWDNHFVVLPWNTHEESAQNPLHLLLLFGCLVALPWGKPNRLQVAFIATVLLGFVVFCAQLKWQSYNSRLHTPWFVLALAWAAVMLQRLPTPARRSLLAVLALATLPNALLNYTRPLLTLPPARITPWPGILSIPRNLQYFAYRPNLAPAYLDAALRIADQECADVGVRAWPDAWVYPILVLTRNAGTVAEFRDVDVSNVTARFAGAPLRPCLLLQLGPYAATPPAWAAGWTRLSDWHEGLGFSSVAVFAPSP